MIRSDHQGHKTSGQVEGRWEGRKRKEENENHIYGIDWLLFIVLLRCCVDSNHVEKTTYGICRLYRVVGPILDEQNEKDEKDENDE